eukprot:scaffold114547_cov27-Prasinocladus_malaysianus.AAC.1
MEILVTLAAMIFHNEYEYEEYVKRPVREGKRERTGKTGRGQSSNGNEWKRAEQDSSEHTKRKVRKREGGGIVRPEMT